MIEPGQRKPFSVLRRFMPRPSADVEAALEACDFCGEQIPAEHRHLLEVETRQLRCVCRACSILFDRESASQGRYRLVGERRLSLDAFRMSDAQWESLRIPVGMAFFFCSSAAGQVVALYPSPMGATESTLPPGVWEELASENPVLKAMQPDVEALLVHRIGAARQQFLVPIDDGFRLVGLIRTHWRGLSGGEGVWKEIDQFFDALMVCSERWTPPVRGDEP